VTVSLPRQDKAGLEWNGLNCNGGQGHEPAFFSCSVNSAQLTFMRSRRAIHSSACSCGGMDSQRFSILASVGLEMAWVLRTCVL
jgi:hypothetical protein